MQLSFQEIPALPKLAWLAVADPSQGLTRVVHGSLVETRPEFFAEAVWDGDFSSGRFETTETFFGSGAVVDGTDVVFVSSSATTDYLYFAADETRVVVANSLPLLLAHRGDRLDPKVRAYDAINHSVIAGIERYARDIPTARGAVRRLMYRNLRVRVGGIEEFEKAMPPRFPTYESYRDYVGARYARIAANAIDAARIHPMAIFSTQSRGYDTTALNAIAASSGVDKAFTVTRGKEVGTFANEGGAEQANDDGTEICEVLGIPCVPIDRRSYQKDFDDEYLYYATLDSNQDVNLREITRYATGATVLLTGTLGELWYTRESYDAYIQRYNLLDDQLKRVDLGGHGLTEVRLHAGIVHLPFPYIGARQREDIFAITESAAMDAWRLRNRYDRPVPRRMAEDAGVPRSLFGQVKIATVVQFAPPPVPIGAQLRTEYFRFLTQNRLLAGWQLPLFPAIHRINSILWFASEQRHAWMHYFQRAISKIIRRNFRFGLGWRHLNGSLFCFCANRRADEYASMISGVAAAPALSLSAPASPARLP